MNAAARSLTRIITTLGPACADAASIRRLIEAGATIVRLNFSHGTLQEHTDLLAAARQAAARLGTPLAVLGDLQGPKIRVGPIAGGGVDVAPGDEVCFARGHFVTEPSPPRGGPLRLCSTYARLVDEVEAGQRLLIDDGAVRCLVTERTPELVRCAVVQGGRIGAAKGINLPDSAITASALSERDLECVAWAIEHDLDYLALSFVRGPADVQELARRIAEMASERGREGLRVPIVAKIERPQAVEAAEAILQEADAIMIARGDLGVEMDLPRVPIVQMKLQQAARAYGKPCIVATQMLQSMIESPVPTRAEVTDVAAAIMQGVDATMLSGETAVGRWPALAVDAMRRVALEVEQHLREQPAASRAPSKLVEIAHRTAALAHGVWHVAHDSRAACLVVWSQRGGGARYLSQNDFHIPIIAISSDERAVRQMQLFRGVVPVHMEVPPSLGDFTRRVDALLLEGGWAKRGDRVVLVAGSPLGVPQVTNALALHEVGDPMTGFP